MTICRLQMKVGLDHQRHLSCLTPKEVASSTYTTPKKGTFLILHPETGSSPIDDSQVRAREECVLGM